MDGARHTADNKLTRGGGPEGGVRAYLPSPAQRQATGGPTLIRTRKMPGKGNLKVLVPSLLFVRCLLHVWLPPPARDMTNLESRDPHEADTRSLNGPTTLSITRLFFRNVSPPDPSSRLDLRRPSWLAGLRGLAAPENIPLPLPSFGGVFARDDGRDCTRTPRRECPHALPLPARGRIFRK